MIPYGRQSLNDDDIAAVVSALKGDWLTTGPLVEEFESALEKVVGAPCVSVSSGTAALHCAYAAIDLEPGDEVITPPITFIATQATAALFGAKIVFADVQPDTANIDPEAVEAAITPRTKAIVAVDYAGHPADLDELRAIADKHKVYLIEDAAHSIGSTYKGRPVGSIADITTFSFFPTKNMTTAEGGAVASIHPELLDEVSRDANLILTTSSTSSLEFIARGFSVGVACAVENQKQYYDAFARLGIAAQIGFRTSSGWNLEPNTIHKLITEPGFRADLAKKAYGLIDFKGASRIVDAIMSL